MKIIEALAKLDVLNDNHWTNDGLPRLEPVRMLVGNQSISRDDVTKAAPGYSRQTPNLELATADAAAPQGEQAAPSPVSTEALLNAAPASVALAAAAPAADAGGEDGKVHPENETGAEGSQAGDAGEFTYFTESDSQPSVAQQLAVAQERMAELEFHKIQVDRAHAEATAYIDGLIRQIESAKPAEDSQSAIRQYLDSQSQHYEQRAVAMKRWTDAKIDLKAVIPQAAPIDQKMGQRNREQYR